MEPFFASGIKYGSRAWTTSEKWFHSFIGETAAGRWGIGQLFYWVCDCAALKEVLDYEGSISMIKPLAQELLGYQFAVIHRNTKMMKDVDSLNRFYEPEIAEFLKVAAILRSYAPIGRMARTVNCKLNQRLIDL